MAGFLDEFTFLSDEQRTALVEHALDRPEVLGSPLLRAERLEAAPFHLKVGHAVVLIEAARARLAARRGPGGVAEASPTRPEADGGEADARPAPDELLRPSRGVYQLLVKLFAVSQLRDLLHDLDPKLLGHLPGDQVPSAEFVFRAVDVLVRFGTERRRLREFLLARRPQHAAEIDAVLG